MNKFNIGDMVYDKYFNKIGTVVESFSDGDAGVDFGEGFNGHDLNGTIFNTTGWYCSSSSLELAKKGNKWVY